MRDDSLFSELVSKWCHRVEIGGKMPLYPIPLTCNRAYHCYVYPGKKGGHKMIPLVGASVSGKTRWDSTIEIVNFIFSVEWDDPVGSKLHPFAGQTNFLSVYDHHHYDGLLFPGDTPGYDEDFDQNQEITKMIQTYFEDMEGEQLLDLMGFVKKSTLPNPTATDKYIYESIRLRQFDSLVVIFRLQREGSPAIAEQRHLQIRQFRLFCSNKILAESEELKRKFNIGTYNNFLWYVNQKKVFPRFYHFHFLVRRVAG